MTPYEEGKIAYVNNDKNPYQLYSDEWDQFETGMEDAFRDDPWWNS